MSHDHVSVITDKVSHTAYLTVEFCVPHRRIGMNSYTEVRLLPVETALSCQSDLYAFDFGKTLEAFIATNIALIIFYIFNGSASSS